MRNISFVMGILSSALFLTLFIFSCNGQSSDKPGSEIMELKIESPAFNEGDFIPSKYTCDDVNISPPLKFGESPSGTKSLALISDDPDAPMGTWVHWVMYNIPPTVQELPENVPSSESGLL